MEEHPQARFVINTLSKAGFLAYYAGGWVRDYLLGHPSDDIDIATNAPPETIQALFPHTVPIGIAFGIILVIIDGHQYEVATFRQDLDYKDGRRPSRVEFTCAIEDAKRRDFTINGMFFDPIQQKVLDYVNGREDLEKKIIRAIGNPHERIQEDRLRMIRAVRLACRFSFTIEPKTEEAIRFHAKELFPAVAIERIWQEFTKGHSFHKLPEMLLTLHKFGLLSSIFPVLETVSLENLEKRLEPTKCYPPNSPVIALILPLFPHYDLKDQIDLCKKLKLANEDVQFVTFFSSFKKLTDETSPVSLYEWAYAYANPLSALCVEMLFNKNSSKFEEHFKRKEVLKHEIERIHKKNPVLTSEDLKNAGILPGKSMGLLLKEGEKIAINQNIKDPQKVLAVLKTSAYWPKTPKQEQ